MPAHHPESNKRHGVSLVSAINSPKPGAGLHPLAKEDPLTQLPLQAFISSPAFVRCLPFALFMVVLALRGALEERIDTRWLYSMQAGCAALALAILARHYQELRWRSRDPLVCKGFAPRASSGASQRRCRSLRPTDSL